ncbi:MAG: hypothetical protein JSS14_15030 [Proteobacteria bacterium]|nr:hypothetical protein [Pseudomonadota bacterium]
MSTPLREWWVFVHAPDVGYIGTVEESTEEFARLAALSKYAKKGERAERSKRRQMRRPETMHIYEDDEFDVRLECSPIMVAALQEKHAGCMPPRKGADAVNRSQPEPGV